MSHCDTIDDLYDWFLRREQEGKLVIQRYDTLEPGQLSLWHGMVLEELIANFSGAKQDNVYMRFVQEKLPAVWERFLHEAK